MKARLCAAVVIASILGVPAAPVAAAPAPVRIQSVSAENVKPGDTVRVRFRVTNTGSATETAIVVVGGGLRCETGCRAEPRLGPGKSRNLEARLVAPEAGPGETSGLNISVAVRLGGQNYFDHKTVYVHGAGRPATDVARVSGRVRDSGGKAIRGAALTVQDSAGHEYRKTSDRSGRFSLRSTADRPIAAGSITVVATMDGYRTARKTLTGAAGGAVNALVTLTAVATPTRTPSSSAVTASPLAAVEGTVEPTTPPALAAVSDEGGGSLPFKFLGGLLIAAGLGALTLVMIRRRRLRIDA
ncbi:carboxypeptidase regulatory-like domain-containing protein [Actinoplanes sp. LDG1-06]|uniref:Carboxypeptidase regulatory-like domain-containing protein n=1 Tax=Paractinoplanes ovalisporus TaxID=2810368 RepID=A0ABS2AHY2_9ACTN|nr:carboxypeptidase-like regulatory domain-containing protein [Actinoplanes ovalisporus]MBM2619420.1 carboxypeptidase regulatory-like domain-containing protein [Actinoplanes ovalisporus]